ncbi:MAG: acyltransferase [Pseudomonadota bacterium]|nr:acyltransferase [Pseudomonadota bacterium]
MMHGVHSADMTTEPRPGSSSHWASLPESGRTIGLWFMYLSHRAMGRALFRALAWLASWYFITVRPIARRASIQYQHRIGVLPADANALQSWRAAARHVRRFADALLDKALVWTGGLSLDAIRREVDQRFDDAVAADRGGVLVVAHFGNLEVLRRLGEAAKQLRLHILVHTRHAERFNRMLTRINPQSAERLLQVTDVDTATIAHLAARVELGDFVVLAADRVPVTSERVLDVPFLGHDAAFPIGPWVLAAALDCPVYWLACYQRAEDDGRYTLVCERLRERVVLPRATREAALRNVIADYAHHVERACREAPLSWFNFFPFWRTPK